MITQHQSVSTRRFLGPLATIPWNDLLFNPESGRHILQDFTTFGGHADASGGALTPVAGVFNAYIYQGGFINNAAYIHGGITMGSDGDNEGVTLQPNTSAFQIINDGSVGKLIFGARFKTSTITDTKHGFYIGLTEQLAAGGTNGNFLAAAKPIGTNGTLTDNNFIGFHRLEGDGDQIDVVYKADGQTQQSPITDGLTLVADTWYVVALVFDPQRGDIQLFLNSATASTTLITRANIAAATFPSDVLLTPTFGLMNATGTTPGNTTLDYIVCAQMNP